MTALRRLRGRQVFLSHARGDQAAEYLRNALASLRINVGEVSADANPGAWAEQVERAIAGADAFVVFLPDAHSKNRHNVFFELGLAQALAKQVYVVSEDADTSLDIGSKMVVGSDAASLDRLAQIMAA